MEKIPKEMICPQEIWLAKLEVQRQFLTFLEEADDQEKTINQQKDPKQ